MKNTIKNKLIKLAGIAIASSILYFGTIKPLCSRYINKEIISKEISLNKNDFRTYTTNKDEKEGLKDIRKNVIQKGNKEDSWVYFPEKEKWCEVGIQSKKAGSKINSHYLEKVLEKSDDCNEIIIYHNHPVSAFDEEPSRADFKSMVGQTIKIKEKYPSKDVKFKICHEYGTTEFFLTEEGIKEFFKYKKIPKSKLEDALKFNGKINKNKNYEKDYDKFSKYIKMNVKTNKENHNKYR